MAQVINTNVMSLNAQRNLNSTNSSMQQSIERLSSGLRINSAADDAAGLAISERFTSQIKGQDQAIRNANDGLSFAQTAEGALDEVGNMSQRIRELAVQSANDTNSQSDREAINQEVQSLIDEVDRIAESTEFNGQKILSGITDQLEFQVGANEGQTIKVDGVDSRSTSLGSVTQETQRLTSGDSDFTSGGYSDGVVFTTSGSGGFSDGDPIDIGDDTYTYSGGGSIEDGKFDSVDGLVDLINRNSGDTGIEAVKNDSLEVNLGALDSAAAGDETLTINNVDFQVGGSGDYDSTEELADAINKSQLQTDGISAEVDNGELKLQSSNGETIDFSFNNSADSSFDGLSGTADLSGGVAFEAGFELRTDAGKSIGTTGLDAINGVNITEDQSKTLNQVSVSDRSGAQDAITTMDFVIGQVSSIRSELGAAQNRMESTISNLEVGSENLNSARSRIQDADFAKESSELTRNQVLQQAGTSMLAQANQVPQNALSLLQ